MPNSQSVCRICRRAGVKLFLKGTRCEAPKCAIGKRDYPPGEHAWRRSKLSAYAIRLREKQKAKHYYGVREKQFMTYFHEADRQKGNTGNNLFILLERRLDNVLCRSGAAHSRAHARQMITHGNIEVTGRKVDRPSYLVSPGEVIAAHGPDRIKEAFGAVLEANRGREVPSWLEVDANAASIRMVRLPAGEEISEGFQAQYVIEICSR